MSIITARLIQHRFIISLVFKNIVNVKTKGYRNPFSLTCCHYIITLVNTLDTTMCVWFVVDRVEFEQVFFQVLQFSLVFYHSTTTSYSLSLICCLCSLVVIQIELLNKKNYSVYFAYDGQIHDIVCLMALNMESNCR